MRNLKRKHLYLPIAIGVLTPSLIIFLLEVFVGRISLIRSVITILQRQFAAGHNLFLIMIIGFIPFAILMGITAIVSIKIKGKQLDCIFYGGLTGIVALMAFGHIAIWYPLYGGGHMSSTAVIGFFFIPFYCIATMGMGLVIGWAVSFLPYFKGEI